MPKEFNVFIKCNKAYADGGPGEEYQRVSVEILDEHGSPLFYQYASEELLEEYDPTDTVDLLLRILKDDPNYNIKVTTGVEE